MRVQALINAASSEIPTLKLLSGSLGAKLAKRKKELYLAKQADALAETIIAEWKKG
jgi:hypothetical protein